MFNWFKKKNDKIETFPTAQEMLEKTEERWPMETTKKILAEIQKASANGKRSVYFFKAKISEQTCKELRLKGYCIDISTYDGVPYFKVSW